jgi:hypothetical protein
MSAARAERRRAARAADPRRHRRPWEPPAEPHGCVILTLDDDRACVVGFPTTGEAERFLAILGPAPATEQRLQAALKAVGKGSVADHG